MAINAQFTADFSQFDGAVKSASGTLKKLEGDANSTAKQVTKMADDSAKSFRSASTATQDWTKDFSKFDNVLSAAGINIGGHVKAIGELKTATLGATGSMSGFATAGLAAGAALAGWELGRWVMEITGLDQAVAELWLTILNRPQLKFETEQAQLDAIQSAIMKGAAAGISYAEAVKYLNTWQKEHNLTLGYSRTAWADSMKQARAWGAEIEAINARGDFRAFNADLESQDYSLEQLSLKYGVHTAAIQNYVRDVKAYADAGVESQREQAATLKEIEATYKQIAETDAATKKAMKERNKEINDANLAALKETHAMHERIKESVNARIVAELNAKAALAGRQGLDLYGNRPAEAGSPEAATAAYEQQAAALRAVGASVAELDELYLQYQDTVLQTGATVQDAGNKTKVAGDQTQYSGVQAQQAAGSYQQLTAVVQGVAGSFQNMWTAIGHGAPAEQALRNFNDMAAAYGKAGIFVQQNLPVSSMTHRAAGGPVTAGVPYMVGEHGPELFMPKTSGAIVAGAGGVQVNVSGLILSDDPQARQQLATIIQDALVTAYRQHGNRQPV